MRLAAAILLAVLAALPLTVLPSAPVTWLLVPALGAGGAGLIALSVPLVTLGASLVLVAYTLGLVITRAVIDPVAAMAFGATLVLLLGLVHFAGHVHGAALGPSVIAAQIRHWLVIVAVGVAAAALLTAGAAGLAPLLRGAALPVVVVVAGLGAVVTVAGVVALLTPPGGAPAPPVR